MSATHEATHPDLSSLLRAGWTSRNPDRLNDFEKLIAVALSVTVATAAIGDNYAVLRFSLSAIRLRHFDNVYCILAGGASPDPSRLSALKYEWSGDDRFFLVIVPDAVWAGLISGIFPARGGFLVLSVLQFQELSKTSDPLATLRQHALTKISRYRLNPFNTLVVPAPNMFLGRDDSLDLLFQNDAISWAIAGPGRIGKSSLLHHYILMLREFDPVRRQRVAHADFYYEDDVTEHAISRRIALVINPNSRAQEVTPATLKRFVLYEARLRGKLELLFDEVDRVCDSESFLRIAELAKEGYCRLILCGKGRLYETLHDSNHQLHGRLQHLRLEPLRLDDSRHLLLQPLTDLGFRVTDTDLIMSDAYHDTSGYPHLIQHLGTLAVRFAVEEKRDTIDALFMERIRNLFETAQFFVAPIQNLKDERMELLALCLLHEHEDKFTEGGIRKIAARENLNFDAKQISEICRGFYINNILRWDGASFRIATGGLGRYARKLGYFTPRLLELQKKVGRFAQRAARETGR